MTSGEHRSLGYTAAEYERWLAEAGFLRTRRIPRDVPGANGVIIGEKP
jgi:hypothetical protein